MVRTAATAVLFTLTLAAQNPPSEAPTQPGRFSELLKLMYTPVLTASNTEERLKDAPATMLVLSREELLQRGYSDLSELLEDLPGLDLCRPFGDAYVKSYWRGYRNTWGDPFLLLVDGMPMNTLFYNATDVTLVTFPISSIERVEIVYGPASALYGPNAMMGALQIITRQSEGNREGYQRGAFAVGSLDRRIADYTFQTGGATLRLSGRLDDGRLDDRTSEAYEYTRRSYLADRRLWGAFVDDPRFGGQHRSETRNRALDLRSFWGGTEVGLLHHVLDSGYGNEYAADLAQSDGRWARFSTHLYVKNAYRVRSDLQVSTLLRYRRDGVDGNSYFVDGYYDATARSVVAAYSWWQILNAAWSFQQDYEWQARPSLSLNAGFAYEHRSLNEGQQSVYGPYVPVGSLDLKTYPFPAQPPETWGDLSHVRTRQLGGYLQLRWALRPNHRLIAGLRTDDHTQYGSVRTLRAGYVGEWGAYGVKALYGEAFQEPIPRVLYGGWAPGGSNPDLRPETSRTVELHFSRTTSDASFALNPYWTRNRDTIVTGNLGARNLGRREVLGIDAHLQALLPPGPFRTFRVWAYASRLLRAQEAKFTGAGLSAGEGSIGDLAWTKAWLGAAVGISERFQATLRGRWSARRRTVETNPVGYVPAYATLDATLQADFDPLSLSVKVGNLTNRTYFHPGFADGNAGDRPGAFDTTGAWQGSGGYYSSWLAQPGRTVTVSIRMAF